MLGRIVKVWKHKTMYLSWMYLLRRLVSIAFVLCSQRPPSSSSSDGSREEPLVVVAPFTLLSLPSGLLADTGLPTARIPHNQFNPKCSTMYIYEYNITNAFIICTKNIIPNNPLLTFEFQIIPVHFILLIKLQIIDTIWGHILYGNRKELTIMCHTKHKSHWI